MATPKTKTVGACILCGKSLPKSTMGRHILSCRAKHPVDAAGGKAGSALLVQVEGRYAPQYWMFLEVSAASKLGALDAFLREVWLECCGHMSEFEIEGKSYSAAADGFEGGWDDEEMASCDVRSGKVLGKGTKFEHIYDWGSTTKLAGRVVDVYDTHFKKREPVRLLARNDAPAFVCDRCGKPAAVIFPDSDEFACTSCWREHGDDGFVSAIMNSPRVGVCAYGADEAPESADMPVVALNHDSDDDFEDDDFED